MTASEPVEALSLSHLAGPDVAVDVDSDDDERGRHLRQRCAWCGALLVDRVIVGRDITESDTWEPDTIVRHHLDDGEWSIGAYDPERDDVPPDSCMLLAPELTGSTATGEPIR